MASKELESSAQAGPFDPAVTWLLASREPGIRFMADRDLLDRAVRPEDQQAVLDGAIVRQLFAGQEPDGGFGVHPYRKWIGAHWRLVSLVELAVPSGEPRAVAAAHTVLEWLTSAAHRRTIQTINGQVLRCASQEGNALAVACRVGLAADPRVRELAGLLVLWQWPDGGWNCDPRASGRRSSFHESLPPMWGLHEYATATGDRAAADAARRAAELLLEHRVFRSGRTGEPIHRSWTTVHYPPYWHYDVLQAMVVLARMGLSADRRTADALDLLERRRLSDGRWRAGAYWWNPLGATRSPDVVDWGRGEPSEMITLNALRVLKSASRLTQTAAIA